MKIVVFFLSRYCKWMIHDHPVKVNLARLKRGKGHWQYLGMHENKQTNKKPQQKYKTIQTNKKPPQPSCGKENMLIKESMSNSVELLLNNSLSSGKYYFCKVAKVNVSLGYLLWKCQISGWGLHRKTKQTYLAVRSNFEFSLINYTASLFASHPSSCVLCTFFVVHLTFSFTPAEEILLGEHSG